MKNEVILINASRGGIIDENALADALERNEIGGLGIDVYENEPCTSSRLFAFNNIVATPHLGASTREAQNKAGTEAARLVLDVLNGSDSE